MPDRRLGSISISPITNDVMQLSKTLSSACLQRSVSLRKERLIIVYKFPKLMQNSKEDLCVHRRSKDSFISVPARFTKYPTIDYKYALWSKLD